MVFDDGDSVLNGMRSPRGAEWPRAQTEPVNCFDVLRYTWRRGKQHRVFGRSAQLSFYFFLGLLPLIISVIAVLAIVSKGMGQNGQRLLDAASLTVPGAALQLLKIALGQFRRSYSVPKILIEVALSLWWASEGMSSAIEALNIEYGVDETRSLFQRSAIAVSLTIVTALLLVSAAFIAVGNSVAKYPLNRTISEVLQVTHWPVAISLVLVAFATIYFLGPDLRNRRWRWITPGALAGVCIWVAVSIALKVYFHFFDAYQTMYGPMGAAIVLLIWIYGTGVALLMGAEMNIVIDEFTHKSRMLGSGHEDHADFGSPVIR